MKETLVTLGNFPKMFGYFKKALKNKTHFTVWIFNTGNMKEVSRFFQNEEKSSLVPEKYRMFLKETVIMRYRSGEMDGAAVRLPDYQKKHDVRNVFSPGDKVRRAFLLYVSSYLIFVCFFFFVYIPSLRE